MHRTAVMIRQGIMAPVLWLACAAHHLPTAWVLHLDSSGSETTLFMKLRDDLQQLLQHIGNVVPQPAHICQSAARSAERAMAVSHGATCWACKGTSDAADLARR